MILVSIKNRKKKKPQILSRYWADDISSTKPIHMKYCWRQSSTLIHSIPISKKGEKHSCRRSFYHNMMFIWSPYWRWMYSKSFFESSTIHGVRYISTAKVSQYPLSHFFFGINIAFIFWASCSNFIHLFGNFFWEICSYYSLIVLQNLNDIHSRPTFSDL